MSDDVELALEAQQTLLETSLPLVFEAYDDALRRNVADPVVLLVDCEDAIGGEIARTWLGDDVVDDAILAESAERQSEDQTTVFAYAHSLEDCRREIPTVFPYLAPALQPPAAGFLAVSITAGGASALVVPPDARPE
ncbi:MAG: hypothetical protein DCC67_12485 [Planctomycetota bacterium]|nr:MAG: hypothetical protein DCC67_12485 [Planctomycetota bacterium]